MLAIPGFYRLTAGGFDPLAAGAAAAFGSIHTNGHFLRIGEAGGFEPHVIELIQLIGSQANRLRCARAVDQLTGESRPGRALAQHLEDFHR